MIFAAENGSLPAVVVPKDVEHARVSKVRVLPFHTHPAVPRAVQTGKSIMVC